MKCIFCGNSESKVVDSRYLKDSSIRRRRECLKCGKRFTTYETVENSPMVVTNVNNEREAFKLDKLIESIKYATFCQECDMTADEIAKNIEIKLIALGKQEITTKDIVKVSLEVLIEISAIACLVYYTQHTDCDSFDDIRRFINR